MLTVYCSCWIGNGLYQSSAALVCFLASYLRPATSQPFSPTQSSTALYYFTDRTSHCLIRKSIARHLTLLPTPAATGSPPHVETIATGKGHPATASDRLLFDSIMYRRRWRHLCPTATRDRCDFIIWKRRRETKRYFLVILNGDIMVSSVTTSPRLTANIEHLFH